MRTFAQTPTTTQQTPWAKPPVPGPTQFGPRPDVNSAQQIRRAIGNQAASRMWQTTMPISKPGDEHEHDAPRAAEQVTPMPESRRQRACTCGGACPTCQTEEHQSHHTQTASAASLGATLQRRCACNGAAGVSGECEECGKKKQLGLQAKLQIGEAGDIYEREADRVADQVMSISPHSAVSGSPPRIQRLAGQSTGQARRRRPRA